MDVSWTVKKAECWRIDAFELWCWRRLFESPLDCKEIQPVHPKWDQSWVFIGRTDAEAETPVLSPPHVKSWLIGKDPDAGRDWGKEQKGTAEDEMGGWHHRLDGHEFGWTLGVGDGQGGLVCCDSWGRKESDMTERLNWTEKYILKPEKTLRLPKFGLWIDFRAHRGRSTTTCRWNRRTAKVGGFLVKSVQLLSCVWLFVTPWTTAHQTSLSVTYSWSLLKLLSIASVMPSNHSILCHPFLLLPSIFPNIRIFYNDSVLCIKWPKYWISSASVLPMTIQDLFLLGLTGLISLQSKGLSRVFSNTTVQKHQFFCTQLSLWSNSHIHTWLLDVISDIGN